MNRSIGFPNYQRRLNPSPFPKRFRQVGLRYHREHVQQWRLAFPQNNRPSPDNAEPGLRSRALDAVQLLRGKHTSEPSTRSERPRRNFAVVRNITSHFKSTRDLLRMISLNPGPQGKIRRTSENQIELFIRPQHRCIPKIPVPDFVALLNLVVLRALPSQRHALFLRLNRHKLRPWQPPRCDHPDRTNSTSQIENSVGSRTPRSPIPRRQNIIRGKPMPFLKLKQPKIPADRVERFARPNFQPVRRQNDRSRFGPTFKLRR